MCFFFPLPLPWPSLFTHGKVNTKTQHHGYCSLKLPPPQKKKQHKQKHLCLSFQARYLIIIYTIATIFFSSVHSNTKGVPSRLNCDKKAISSNKASYFYSSDRQIVFKELILSIQGARLSGLCHVQCSAVSHAYPRSLQGLYREVFD